MSRGAVRILLSAAGLAAVTGVVGSASAQAPTSAQRWEFAFAVSGAGETTSGVSVTLMARVGIMPNTSLSGVANFGVSRVGGGNGTFFMNFTDPVGGVFESTATRGPTGQAINDTDGNPIAGHFAAFRGSFAPQQGPDFVGSNLDPANGIFSVVGNVARVTSVVGSRAFNYDGNPLGVGVLDGAGNFISGAMVPVYRVLFLPKAAASRTITMNWQNMSARYIFADNGGGATSSGPTFNLPNGQVTFRVPTPGAAALLGLGGLVALRRRRA